MKRLLEILPLILLLASPVALTTGCLSASGKAYKSDKPTVARVKETMTAWYLLVVADKVTSDQEIHMRDLLNAYLAAQKEVQNAESAPTVDLNRLATAQAHLNSTAEAVIAYSNSVTK